MGFNPGDVGHLAEHNRISAELLAQDVRNPASPASAALSATFGTTISAAANGVMGDGATDDLPALQALLNSAAAFGASVTMEHGTTVLLASTVTIPTGTRLHLNGATLKTGPVNSTFLVDLANNSNILIEGGTVDGDKASYAPVTEWRHAISMNNSHNVTLRDLIIKNAKGDGVYVGGVTTECTDITLENVECIGNHRQGMSVIAVSGLEATNCRFIGTAGTNPQSGVDIEPNGGSVVCEDIKFTNCTFSGNAHFGFVVAFAFAATATVRQGGIDLVGCTISGNGTAGDGGGGGLNLRAAVEFTMTGGSIVKNTGPGVFIDWSVGSKNIKLVGVNVLSNSTHGFLLSQSVTNLTLQSCTIKNNGSAAAYDGILLAPSAPSTSIRLIGNVVTGTSQAYGLHTNANVSGLTSIGNDYTGNGTGPTALLDDQATRVQLDGPSGMNTGVRQFYYSTASATILSLRLIGDVVDRFSAATDGRLFWSAGTGALDTQLSRVAAGVLGVGAAQAFRTGVAVTASRPSASAVGAGSQFYDSTLKKPIWSDGTNWKDATGATV